jgi:hypothetical protein
MVFTNISSLLLSSSNTHQHTLLYLLLRSSPTHHPPTYSVLVRPSAVPTNTPVLISSRLLRCSQPHQSSCRHGYQGPHIGTGSAFVTNGSSSKWLYFYIPDGFSRKAMAGLRNENRAHSINIYIQHMPPIASITLVHKSPLRPRTVRADPRLPGGGERGRGTALADRQYS